MKKEKINFPNCIIIGAQKAGTSSYYNWISQHPDIYGPEVMKDFPYFVTESLYNQGGSYLSSFYNNVKDQSIVLKGAVQYIFFECAAKRLFRFDPNVKLILILRDPVLRAFSAHGYLTKIGVEKLSFDDALKRERDTDFSTRDEKANFEYLRHGLYYKQIKAFLKYFDKTQIHIIIYEEMLKDKTKCVRETFNFLNVKNDFIPQFKHINKTGIAKFAFINRFLFSDNKLKDVLNNIFLLKYLVPLSFKIIVSNIIRDFNTANGKKNNISKELYSSLFPYFHKDIALLSQFLDKDLMRIWNSTDQKIATKNRLIS